MTSKKGSESPTSHAYACFLHECVPNTFYHHRRENVPSLVSAASVSSRLLTRMRACVVAGFVTFQVWFPVLVTFLDSTAHVVPPSRDSSIFTFPVTPAELQRIDGGLPMGGQTSPPFGE